MLFNISKSHVLWLLFLVCVHRPVQAQEFRFAWLSDTHVGSTHGATDLDAAVRDINNQTDIAFVLLTGDVTEFGSDEQLTGAKSILQRLRVPLYAIPGNHECRWSESGLQTFPRLFGSDRFNLDTLGIRMIGLHQGPRLRMGDGYWAPEDMRWLDSIFALPRPLESPLIFVTHYPIDSAIGNWYEASWRLARAGAAVILHGHGHANRVTVYDGIPALMGRSALSTPKEPSGYTIVSIKQDTLSAFERVPSAEKLNHWASIPLKPAEKHQVVPVRHYDAAVNANYPGVREVWRVATGWTIGGSASVSSDLAVVADASGMVRALDVHTGSVVWKFMTGAAIYSSPGTTEHEVVVGSTDGSIYCLDLSSGYLKWRHRTMAPVVADPAIVGGVVYIGGSDHTFRALDLQDGKSLWEYPEIAGYIESKPLIYKDKVIFGAWDTYVYCLSRSDGKLIWKWAGGTPGILYSPAACRPVAGGGRVFIAAPDRKLTALNIEDGSVAWRTGRYQVRETIGISEEHTQLFARTMRDSIISLDTRADTCHALWETACGFGYDINSASIVESGGTVVYGTKNGLLIALNASDGSLAWKHRVGDGLVNTIEWLDHHTFVSTSADGNVVCIAFNPQDEK